MNDLYKRNPVFFISFACFIAVTGTLLLIYGKADLFLAVNRYYNTFWDHFFSVISGLGNGLTYFFLIVVLLFVKFRYAFIAACSFGASSGISQFLKRLIFADAPRPKKFFETITDIRLIDGMEVHSSLSFPSGHSITAFSICTLLALLTGNRFPGFIFFMLAFLAAYSRIYLAQHFPTDVLAGSIIGVSVTALCYRMIERSELSKKNWINKSLLRYR